MNNFFCFFSSKTILKTEAVFINNNYFKESITSKEEILLNTLNIII